MPFIKYEKKSFQQSSLDIIDMANSIIVEFGEQGFDLTLRQLYYQFVIRGELANTDRNYKRLGSIISNARIAGLIDWESIVDRTRRLRQVSHWDSADSIIRECSRQFRVDKWDAQRARPEVWIEKDALVGVISGVCDELDVPHFSCRGYSSQSAMWRAASRLMDHEDRDQHTVIFHLGDHDPSGIDMTRDIRERLEMFGSLVVVRRIALNLDQVRRYSLPPNPAKLSDSRSTDYVSQFGLESWELDALDPSVIVELIRSAVLSVRDDDEWDDAVAMENEARESLRNVSDNWETVVEMFG